MNDPCLCANAIALKERLRERIADLDRELATQPGSLVVPANRREEAARILAWAEELL